LVVAFIVSVCAARDLRAEDIYKSVDAQGHVVYSDQRDPSTDQSIVEMADPQLPQLPPRTIHFCWTNCFTLVLHDGTYARADGTEETWTVDRFTPNSVRLIRHDAPADWNGFSKDVAYEGDVANDRLINITVNGKATSGVDAAWGAALNTLPGSNAERDHPAGAALVSTTQAPPPLPTEEQPMNSQDGALWTPGYWSWDAQRYHWVQGSWVRPPQFGLLWTPAYWGFAGGYYLFHPGYWAPQVGYYGGINYGFGYTGGGFVGGRWVGNSFSYNRAVSNVNPGVIHNSYSETASGRVTGNRLSLEAPHIAQATEQRQYSQPSSRLPAPTPSANAPAAITHRSLAPAPKIAEATDTSAPAADRPSQRTSVSNAVGSQGTSKQTGTPKSVVAKPVKLQQ
jgi:hypothetical protein